MPALSWLTFFACLTGGLTAGSTRSLSAKKSHSSGGEHGETIPKYPLPHGGTALYIFGTEPTGLLWCGAEHLVSMIYWNASSCLPIENVQHLGSPRVFYKVAASSCKTKEELAEAEHGAGHSTAGTGGPTENSTSSIPHGTGTTSAPLGTTTTTTVHHRLSAVQTAPSPPAVAEGEPTPQLIQYYDEECLSPTGFVLNAAICTTYLTVGGTPTEVYKLDCGEYSEEYLHEINGASCSTMLTSIIVIFLGAFGSLTFP